MHLFTQIKDLVKYVWTHPGNRGGRLRALGRLFHWQFRKRFVRGPWIINTVFGRRLLMLPDSTVCSMMYYTGMFEWDEMNFLLRALRHGDGFVDIGANIGAHTLVASTCVRAEDIWAIEANPANISGLKEQLSINQITGVKILPYAVGAKRGQVYFSARMRETGTITEHSGKNTIVVECRTLDELFLPEGMPQTTIAKMDVEGCEVDVLLGARRLLASAAITVWLFEASNENLKERGHTLGELLQDFREHDYEFYTWHETNRILSKIDPSVTVCGNLIACHKSIDWLNARLGGAVTPIKHC